MAVEKTETTQWRLEGKGEEILTEITTVHGSDKITFGSLVCTADQADQVAELLTSAAKVSRPSKKKT